MLSQSSALYLKDGCTIAHAWRNIQHSTLEECYILRLEEYTSYASGLSNKGENLRTASSVVAQLTALGRSLALGEFNILCILLTPGDWW
jgi:hypothetical protein